MIKPRSISGFADYSEAENAALSGWLLTIEETFRMYGFSRLLPRPLELRDVLLSKGGIQKQVFGISRLPDDTPTDMALPFDRTVPLAHWVAKFEGEIVFPYKRYDVSYSFRGERAQAGRFQGFFQADVDIIGRDALDESADAETIAVLFAALNAIGLTGAYIRLNNIALVRGMLAALLTGEEQRAAALALLDDMLKLPADVFEEKLRALAGAAAEGVLAIARFTGSVKEFAALVPADDALQGHYAKLQAVYNGLLELGVPEGSIAFTPAIVRGLDYYTGTVFETFLRGYERFGSIASGGRYDDLAGTFTKNKLPGVGGSIGVTRLFDVLTREKVLLPRERTESDVFVGARAPELKPLAREAATLLRGAGYRTDLYSAQGNLKKQLNYADNKGFAAAIMVMDAGSFVVKRLGEGTQQDLPTAADAVAAIKEFLPRK